MSDIDVGIDVGLPDYLNTPSLRGHKYGTLVFQGNHFLLTGEPVMLEFAKRIFPGAKNNHKNGIAFQPSRREVCDLNWLLMRYPVDIQCAELDSERLKAVEYYQKRRAGDDVNPTIPPSEFLGKLYPYQQTAVSFLTVNRRALLGDGMGLGKTWSALGAVATAKAYPVLIVCQTHVQRQWQRVIGALFDLPCVEQFGLYDTPFDIAYRRGEKLAPILHGQTPYKIPDTPFSIIHYGLISWWGKELRERGYPIVIFDEVQDLRHIGTKKYSEASLLSSDADYVWGLSGTPVYGYGTEIWAVSNAIEFHYLGSQDAFTREWCTGYGEKIVSEPRALHDQLVREGFLLRRKAEDVAKDLPKVVRHVQDVDHDRDLYDSLINVACEKASRYNLAGFTEKGKIARDVERDTRRAAGVSKARFVADFTAALIESGERPLVYAWHHDVHDILQERLAAYFPAVITGRENETKKNENLRHYIDGKTDLVILSLRSAAGLDGLQHRATCCVFAELDWSPAIHCFDDQTEILTPDGFKGVDEIFLGDLVAAFEVETGAIKWMPINAKIDRPLGKDEKIFVTNSKKISLAVTGDHRMVYRSLVRSNSGNYKSKWQITEACQLSGVKRRYVPICGMQEAPGVDLTDAELMLIGLYLSDGSFNGRYLTIYQAVKQPHNKQIVDILNQSGMEWRVWQRKRKDRSTVNWYCILSGYRGKNNSGCVKPCNGWHRIREYLDKNLSQLFENCTRAQLQKLIYGIWLGDGTKKDYKILRITGTNLIFLERLQSLCVRRNLSARISKRKNKTSAGNDAYDIHIGEVSDSYLQDNKMREEFFAPDPSYTEGSRVWCASNALGTLVTRRRGKVVITGNSQCETRIARIGVDKTIAEVPSYYCVARNGYDEVMIDVLGLKTSQFVGLMGDEPEDYEEKQEAEKRAQNRIQLLVDRLKADRKTTS